MAEDGHAAPLALGRRSGSGTGSDLLLYGNTPLLTVAPAGPGRARSCLLPVLTGHPGSTVVIDLGGELYASTAQRRRDLGHTVVRLDPFGVAGPDADTFDPLDLLRGLGAGGIESGSLSLADVIVTRSSYSLLDDQSAFALLSAVIGYLVMAPERSSAAEIHPTLHQDDTVYNLAVVLDTIGKKIPPMSFQEIAAFLQLEDAARSRVLATTSARLTALGGQDVRRSLESTSFDLARYVAGEPVTVYLILPPERLPVHATLLRLWVGALLLARLGARQTDAAATLFLLDHCAELGTFPLLETLLRVPSAAPIRAWTFWTDLRQLRNAFPATWPEMISGCGAVQVFGTTDVAAAAESAALFDRPAREVLTLGPGEQLLRLGTDVLRTARLPG